MIVGLCQTLDTAIARADADDFAVAILDFGLGPKPASPFARRLANRGVPFILYTGKSRHEPSLAEWRACPIVEKPASVACASIRHKNRSVALILVEREARYPARRTLRSTGESRRLI